MANQNFLIDQKADEVISVLKKEALKNSKLKPSKFSPFPVITKRFWARILDLSDVSEVTNWSEVSSKMMSRIAENLTAYKFKVSGKGVFKEEFVTAGGINLKEIDLKTMELKKIPGLHVAGEATNVDGITGGFNFQNAWTGGFLSGKAVAEKLKED